MHPVGTGAGIKNTNKNIGQNTHHDKRDNTTLHKDRPKTTTQHGGNTTWQQHNMVAAQNRVQTWLGMENSTKGKKVETTIHHAKQPQLSVRVSTIESSNEEIEIKLSSLNVCCSSFQSLAAANWKDERPDVCALGTLNIMWLAERVLYVEDEGCSRYLR